MTKIALPPSWVSKRLKWLFSSCKNGAWGAEPDGESDVVCIRAADFDGRLGRLNVGERTLRSIDSEIYKKLALRTGDIILEKSGGGEKQLVGRAVLFTGEDSSITSNFLARCRPSSNMEPAFVNYLLLAIYNTRGTFPHIKQSTGIQNLDLDSFLNIRVRIPPLDTQRRIAQFLDEKTARIDTLIEKKRELLDRLAEKRQALITRAVTKGLNPDVPMKSSGIDWLGDIPAHWEMRRLNSFCEFQSGKAHESFIEIDSQYVCVNARFISTNGTASKRCSKNLTPARPGDILMVMSDLPNGRALARSFLVDARDQYAVNQRVCRIRPQYGSCAYFSFQLDRNPQLLKQNDGKEQTHLSNSNFKLLSLLVPPETEQRNIVDHLNEVSSSIGEASVKVEESANRLEEYRSALITSAVVGQIPELL